jgi:hypothetical protein
MRITPVRRALVLTALVGALAGCGQPDVDLAGEGARRTGALPSRARKAEEGATVALVAAGDLSRPAPVKQPTESQPARGRARPPRGGGKDDYEVGEVDAAACGRIEGMVKLSATPFIRTIVVDKDVEACGHESHPSERCVFDKDTLGLANCVITLEDIKSGKDWPEAMRAKDRTATIDQKHCQYIPHVLVMRENTQLLVDNSDEALHNIHGYYESMLSTIFNFGSGAGVKGLAVAEAYLQKPGVNIMKCDVHPWMNAYVHTVTNPYFAVTDAKGRFVLEGVPEGEYTIKVWHEGMQETPVVSENKISGYDYGPDWVETAKVTVEAGGTATLSFTAPAPTDG